MDNTTNDELAVYDTASERPAHNSGIGFSATTTEGWELAQRQAKALSSSQLVPKQYQGPNAVADCMLALDMANRMGANPLLVMQNLYIVQGRPGWSSTFLIATVNHCGRFTALRYEEEGTAGEDGYRVRAWANEKATGERLNGTWITWEMVKSEGWLNKSGSKWKTMPEQMGKYRAAAFWQRTYAPEIGMGLHTVEEVQDIAPAPLATPTEAVTVRLSPRQMKEVKYEIEVMGKSTSEEVLERNPNLPEDQRLLIASWEYRGEEQPANTDAK